MKPDLTKTVDAAGMRQLSVDMDTEGLEGPAPPGTEWQVIDLGLEGRRPRTMRVLVTKPETFDGRAGYRSDFIPGWDIPMPIPGSDVQSPRRGADGPVLQYEHFSTVQSKSRRMPAVVAVNIDGHKSRKITRTSTPWRFDGRLDVADQIGDEVYAEEKNVLDRGHMVRREDPIWGDPVIASQANVDTFHFTNSCPQIARVNQRTWLGLENYILLNSRNEDLLVSVFTGPVFRNDDMKYRGAPIPKSFFKIVAIVTDNGRPSATGYEVSQEEELSDLEFVFGPYKTYQASIASIEDKTGLKFGDLKKYDGFSVSGRGRVELESLESVRI